MSGSVPTENMAWAESAAVNRVVEPTVKRTAGWNPGDEPPAEWLNWWQRGAGRWISYYGSKNVAGGIVGLHDTTCSAEWTSSGGATGLKVTGQGAGYGIHGVSGATAGSVGVYGETAGGTGSAGVYGISLSTGVGGYFDGAGTGTGATDDAIQANQNIYLSGSDPARTTGFSNRLTPMNIPKAWGRVYLDATPDSDATGFNFASCAYGGSFYLDVTLATAVTSYATTTCVIASISSNGSIDSVFGDFTSSTVIRFQGINGGAIGDLNNCLATLYFVVFAQQ